LRSTEAQNAPLEECNGRDAAWAGGWIERIALWLEVRCRGLERASER